jgi:hypothetical protein
VRLLEAFVLRVPEMDVDRASAGQPPRAIERDGPFLLGGLPAGLGPLEGGRGHDRVQ